ncbi:MAG: hypothetical protein HQL22_09555 [Candidatus Omnitrophica bacterium]|nr:hypothetical protein [Candidatus Omnitrophota bacterium]
MLLRCTQKFLTELRLKKADIKVYPQAEHSLDEWYAHVFYLYPRRKCAVFAHSKMTFCFFALDVTRDDLNDLGGIFRKRLAKALFDEHYPAEVIKLFNERMTKIHVTTTLDRVVIGTVNQMVRELTYRGNESERTMYRNEAVLGAYYRRGCFMAFRGGAPLNQLRDVLVGLEELKGVEIPEPLSDEAISAHLGVRSIYF